MAACSRDRGVQFAIANRTFDLGKGCHYGANARRSGQQLTGQTARHNWSRSRTLQVGLATLQGQHTTPIPLLAAGLLVSLAPVLIVFLLSQRTLARGLTAGAVK